MILRNTLRIILTGLVLSVGISESASADVYCDRVWVWGGATGASYTISPGIWTLNGVEKARTFKNGSSIDADPNTKATKTQYVSGTFNDFHYGIDVYTPVGGAQKQIVNWCEWNSATLLLPNGAEVEIKGYVTTGGGVDQVMVMCDFTANPADPTIVVQINNDPPVYSGPESGFSPGAFNLEHVASRYLRNLGDVPAVSEWGLVALGLIVLAAGTVVLRRRIMPLAG